MQQKIPYKILTDRLVIRCYRPEDAEMVLQAITNSLNHLKPWMPWAQAEPSSVESKRVLLQQFQDDFIHNIDHTFGLFNKHEDVLIGSSGLHTRLGSKAREIGYWINAAYLNQGYATESTKALIRVGFEHLELEYIEIHCDPKNIVSQHIPKKLGFKLATIRKGDAISPYGTLRDTMVWSLPVKKYLETVDDYPKIEVLYESDR